MSDSKSIWKIILDFFISVLGFFRRKDKSMENSKELSEPETEETVPMPEKKSWSKDQLLAPIRHNRYITIYCIADLKDGDSPIKDRHGDIIASISSYSLKRLKMEGTGRLEDGRVVNVDKFVGGEWNYAVMPETSPDGLGIYGAALKPWVSLAHQKGQLDKHSLFKRKVIIPSLYGYETPEKETLSGKFEVHDTGGGLRECPYEGGLWRTGPTKSTYGQFDLFCGTEKTYKTLLGSWNSYREVIVMPRDLSSVAGRQEAVNLLLDAGLVVDNIYGPKTEAGIKKLQGFAGLKESGVWDEDTERFVVLSLDNWK